MCVKNVRSSAREGEREEEKNVKRNRMDDRNKLQVSAAQTSSSGQKQEEGSGWGGSVSTSLSSVAVQGDVVWEIFQYGDRLHTISHFAMRRRYARKTGSIRSDSDVTSPQFSRASVSEDTKFTHQFCSRVAKIHAVEAYRVVRC
jgi:hypothetical protein